MIVLAKAYFSIAFMSELYACELILDCQATKFLFSRHGNVLEEITSENIRIEELFSCFASNIIFLV